MGSAKELRGESRLLLGPNRGELSRVFVRPVRNPVILLDEIDRSAEEANRDIMGVLVELLDPAQNHSFRDTYIDFPINLSHAIFLATANNTGNIATAVMDRLEKSACPVTWWGKNSHCQEICTPKLLEAAGLKPDQFIIDDVVWPAVVRPLGYDMVSAHSSVHCRVQSARPPELSSKRLPEGHQRTESEDFLTAVLVFKWILKQCLRIGERFWDRVIPLLARRTLEYPQDGVHL